MKLNKNWASIEQCEIMVKAINTHLRKKCNNVLKIEKFTKSQFKSLVELVEIINDEYIDELTYHGHCELANKTCPVFDYRKVLGLNEQGFRRNDENTNLQGVSVEIKQEKEIVELPLESMDRGKKVSELQGSLNIYYPDRKLIVDGIFGKATEILVVDFQEEKELVVDGIVGQKTWVSLMDTLFFMQKLFETDYKA